MYEFGERRFFLLAFVCMFMFTLPFFTFFLPKELYTGMHDLRLVWFVETMSIATLNRLN